MSYLKVLHKDLYSDLEYKLDPCSLWSLCKGSCDRSDEWWSKYVSIHTKKNYPRLSPPVYKHSRKNILQGKSTILPYSKLFKFIYSLEIDVDPNNLYFIRDNLGESQDNILLYHYKTDDMYHYYSICSASNIRYTKIVTTPFNHIVCLSIKYSVKDISKYILFERKRVSPYITGYGYLHPGKEIDIRSVDFMESISIPVLREKSI